MSTSPYKAMLRLITVGVLATVAFVAANPGPAMAAESVRYPQEAFAAQARAEGLTATQARTLQARVDALVSANGGTQIAINRVRWADGSGDTTLPLSGETRVRPLAGEVRTGTVGAAGTVYNCDYLYLCTFQMQHYGGPRYTYYYCRDYSTPYSFNSYVNNQTAGTRALMKDYHGNVIHVTAGALSAHPTYSGLYTYFIRPC